MIRGRRHLLPSCHSLRALVLPPRAPCRQVQQAPTTMLAAEDLTDEQKKFMNERKQMATK